LKIKECRSTEVNALVKEITDYVYDFYNGLPNKALIEGMYCDSYGSIELMMATLKNSFIKQGMGFPIVGAGKFGKKEGRQARLDMMFFLIGGKRLRFLPETSVAIKKLSALTYDKTGLPEDTNQIEMDYYDSICYALVTHIVELTKNGGLNAFRTN
jgi:hypothetical protein